MQRRIAGLAGAALLVLIAAGAAQAERALTLIEQLAADREVQPIGRIYELISAGAIMYDRCATEYDADGTKKTFNDVEFEAISVAYMQAFQDAYKRRTGKLPAEPTIEAYRQYIADRQKEAKLRMIANIDTRGCDQTTFERVDEYLEKRRQYTLEQQRSH